MNIHRAFLLTLQALVLVALGVSLDGATVEWVGTGAHARWSAPANWSTHAPPGAQDAVLFDRPGAGTVVADVQVAVSSITVASTFAGTIVQDADVAVSGGLTLAGGTWRAGGRRLTVGGALAIADQVGLFDAGTSTVTLSGTASLASPANAFATLVVGAGNGTTTLVGDAIVSGS